MTTPTEPRTEAGRFMLRFVLNLGLAYGFHVEAEGSGGLKASILDIEAEAASQPEPAVTEALRRLDSLAQDESKNGDIAYAAGVTEATGQIRAALAAVPAPSPAPPTEPNR